MLKKTISTPATAPVTVGWYLDPLEAEIARGKLNSEGIPAFLHSQNHALMEWTMILALGGIRLQVPPSAVEDARRVLARDDTLQEDAVPVCPDCGSEQVTPLRGSRSLALLIVHAFQVPLPFNGSGRRCVDCGNRWRDPATGAASLSGK